MTKFFVNQCFDHWPGKTVTESDNNLFCLLTMNHHPVHIDRRYASDQKHGQLLVVGTYVLSLVVGLSVKDLSMHAIANLEYSEVKHLSPTFVGDTLYAKSRVLDITSTNSGKNLIAMFQTTGYNDSSVDVIYFKRKILLPHAVGSID